MSNLSFYPSHLVTCQGLYLLVYQKKAFTYDYMLVN